MTLIKVGNRFYSVDQIVTVTPMGPNSCEARLTSGEVVTIERSAEAFVKSLDVRVLEVR